MTINKGIDGKYHVYYYLPPPDTGDTKYAVFDTAQEAFDFCLSIWPEGRLIIVGIGNE